MKKNNNPSWNLFLDKVCTYAYIEKVFTKEECKKIINIAKKITKPSKVFSSGTKKDQGSVNTQKFKEKLSRLKKSGHVKDATAVFLDVINN